jgi:hypothetical protein
MAATKKPGRASLSPPSPAPEVKRPHVLRRPPYAPPRGPVQLPLPIFDGSPPPRPKRSRARRLGAWSLAELLAAHFWLSVELARAYGYPPPLPADYGLRKAPPRPRGL